MNYGSISPAFENFENARREYLGLEPIEEKHVCYFSLYIETKNGLEFNIVATCECGKKLNKIDIQSRINRV